MGGCTRQQHHPIRRLHTQIKSPSRHRIHFCLIKIMHTAGRSPPGQADQSALLKPLSAQRPAAPGQQAVIRASAAMPLRPQQPQTACLFARTPRLRRLLAATGLQVEQHSCLPRAPLPRCPQRQPHQCRPSCGSPEAWAQQRARAQAARRCWPRPTPSRQEHVRQGPPARARPGSPAAAGPSPEPQRLHMTCPQGACCKPKFDDTYAEAKCSSARYMALASPPNKACDSTVHRPRGQTCWIETAWSVVSGRCCQLGAPVGTPDSGAIWGSVPSHVVG